MKIDPIQPIERFIKAHQTAAKLALGAAIVGAWGVQTNMDVKRSADIDKKNVLLNDIIIGGGMAAGTAAFYYLTPLIMKGKGIKVEKEAFTAFQKIVKKTKEYFPKEAIVQSLGIPLCSGFFGGVAGEIAQRAFPIKYDKPEKVIERANKVIDSASKPASDRFSRLPRIDGNELLQGLDPNFSILTGGEVGKEIGIGNKVKKLVSAIIGTIFIPLVALLPVSTALIKKFPKHKPLIDIGTIATALGTSFIGKASANWFNEEWTNRILRLQIWKDADKKIHELAALMMFAQTPTEKQAYEKQIKKLNDFKEEVGSSKKNLRETVSDLSKKVIGFGKPKRTDFQAQTYNNTSSK